jgi:polyisoprenoid-binding protein YceI
MRSTVLLAAACAASMFASPSADAAEYVVDPDRTEMVVRLSKAGLASAFAHDHVVHATDMEGTVSYDPSDPSLATVAINVDARSLVADDPAMRAKYDVGDALDDDTRADIRETMNSERQLHVERFPDIAFVSREMRATSGGRLEVTGDLTLHGRTNNVTFTTSPEIDGDVLRASAEIPFLQSDYGIEPYSGMLGTVRNRDEAVLIIELVATAVEPTDAPTTGD